LENIKITGTEKTPEVNFDATARILEIKGRSIPENSLKFYDGILAWLERFMKETTGPVEMNVKFEYFNSSSYKSIRYMLFELEKYHLAGNPVTINWYFEEEDEDMKEAGEFYSENLEIPFKMISVEEIF